MTAKEQQEEFRLAQGVMGYLPINIAEEIRTRGSAAAPALLEMLIEPGRDDVVVRVLQEDIAEIRVGPAQDDVALVQVILNEGHKVEAVVRQSVPAGVELFEDPAIQRLSPRSIVKVIMV
jgi:hypothetical protein